MKSAANQLLGIATVTTVLLSGLTANAQGPNGSVNIRPIEDFLQTQGVLPAPFNYMAWIDPKAGLLMAVDYAGLTSHWLYEQSGGAISLATEIEGTVIERPLPDGRAEVTVSCHTRNAAITVASLEDPFTASLLGHNPFEMLAGDEPAVGDSLFKWVFINDAPGAPLPDLAVENMSYPLTPHKWIRLSIEASGTGPLSEAFGAPDGTPGRAQMIQIGLWQTAGMGATADNYPAEHIKLQALGR